MICATLILAIGFFPLSCEGLEILKYLPWASTMSDEEFRHHVEIRIVKKDWLPDNADIQSDGGVLDHYPHPPDKAYKVFKNAKIYKFFARPLDSAMELLTGDFGYNPNLDSIVVIHTISGDAENYFVQNVIAALGMRNMVKNYNVFAVNMPDMQQSMEQTVVRVIYGMDGNYFGLGKAVGSFFIEAIQKNHMRADQIHFIGFCYSSQLAGYIARYIYKNNGGKKVKSILALDPYSLGLSSIRHELVSASDADIVHAYHTNSLIFGSIFRRATADFTFNNGSFQPGCYFSTNHMCSHRRAVLLLWYIILYKDLFQARSCEIFAYFSMCRCRDKQVVKLTYPPEEGPRGKFFLMTSSHKPYGYGETGTDCHAKHADDAFKYVMEFDFTRSNKF